MATDPALCGEDMNEMADEPLVQQEQLPEARSEIEAESEADSEAEAEASFDDAALTVALAEAENLVAAEGAAASSPEAGTQPEPEPPTQPDAPADPASADVHLAEVIPLPSPVEADVAEPASPTTAEAVTAAFGGDRSTILVWPFAAYAAAWLAFASLITWRLLLVPKGTAVYESSIYPFTVAGGVALTAAGPLVILASWLVARRKHSSSEGLFTVAAMRGATATLLGVLVWWIALIAVDFVRLGRLF